MWHILLKSVVMAHALPYTKILKQSLKIGFEQYECILEYVLMVLFILFIALHCGADARKETES